ncbi:hypothetical protein CALVIDRAFT_530991 [Calocera viscosa TUFC12733]|uniref:Uncharacterized protein n=1 Tax=Calocera viscosa (strain TUFC12733) TaxID=1330018 RepID=A0A167H3A4_CALVF|nr:hypothetical protein CALVIDRAFT_530991 [Calocera viscosa TUFC12733]
MWEVPNIGLLMDSDIHTIPDTLEELDDYIDVLPRTDSRTQKSRPWDVIWRNPSITVTGIIRVAHFRIHGFLNKVFVKNRSGRPYTLSSREDPDGKAFAIRERWATNSPIAMGVRLLTGEVKPAPFLIFREGDFVDVAFTLEVVKLRERVVVNLVPEHVIRLVARPSEMTNVNGQHGTEEVPTIRRVLESTIRFD